MTRAVRFIAARPAFTVIVVVTLALGLGVNAAIFSITRAVLLRPLAYRDADRLVMAFETSPASAVAYAPIAPSTTWRGANAWTRSSRSRSCCSSPAPTSRTCCWPCRRAGETSWPSAGRSERRAGSWIARYWVVAPHYFRAMGIPIHAGRDFTAADDGSRDGVAIVSESFARRFWQTTDVIGRHVRPEFSRSTAFWIPRATNAMLTIVGVAGDVREDGTPGAGYPQLIFRTRRIRPPWSR